MCTTSTGSVPVVTRSAQAVCGTWHHTTPTGLHARADRPRLLDLHVVLMCTCVDAILLKHAREGLCVESPAGRATGPIAPRPAAGHQGLDHQRGLTPRHMKRLHGQDNQGVGKLAAGVWEMVRRVGGGDRGREGGVGDAPWEDARGELGHAGVCPATRLPRHSDSRQPDE